MWITLRLYGNLRRFAAGKSDRIPLEIPEGATIRRVLDSLGVPDESWWMAALNDRVVEADESLSEGDLLEVFDPVGGGL